MAEKDDVKRQQEAARRARAREIRAGQARVTRLLQGARRDVLGEVIETEWDRFFLTSLSASIDRRIDDLRAALQDELAAGQRAGWAAGEAMTAGTLEAIGIRVALPELPQSLLTALEKKTAQRITGLTRSAKDRLDRTIATSLLNGQPREDVIRQIGRHVDLGDVSGRPQSIFGSIDRRARFVYQHEVGQVFSRAQALRREQAVSHVPELMKVWVHDGHPIMPRPDHVAMHGQRRRQPEPFINPLTGARLQHPRDPAAPIGETAGCTCDVFLWRPEYGDVGEFIGPHTGDPARAGAAAA